MTSVYPVSNHLLYYHGWLMWTAWALLGYLQIVSNRYLKSFWWLHMWIHRISGTLILILSYAMILAVANFYYWIPCFCGEIHFILGFIVLSFMTAIVLGGVFTKSMMGRLQW